MLAKTELIFISDLHLSLEKSGITRQFLSFLQNRAVSAKSLYILGDLFDTWIGDDNNTPPNKTIKTALKQLVASGTEVFLIVGNRDFLIGKQFCVETGITLLEDYALITIDGESVLLTHGDLLCTDDLAYQAFRSKSRNPTWQQNVLNKPLWLRLLAARWYRFRSYFHKRQKSQEIMDVNQQTVESIMQQFACTTLIHGHTHRPAYHRFLIDETPATRIVLAEWQKDKAQILSRQNCSWQVEAL